MYMMVQASILQLVCLCSVYEISSPGEAFTVFFCYITKCSVSKRLPWQQYEGKHVPCHYGDRFHEASAMLSAGTSVKSNNSIFVCMSFMQLSSISFVAFLRKWSC